jgi:hypothetical protein
MSLPSHLFKFCCENPETLQAEEFSHIEDKLEALKGQHLPLIFNPLELGLCSGQIQRLLIKDVFQLETFFFEITP